MVQININKVRLGSTVYFKKPRILYIITSNKGPEARAVLVPTSGLGPRDGTWFWSAKRPKRHINGVGYSSCTVSKTDGIYVEPGRMHA